MFRNEYADEKEQLSVIKEKLSIIDSDEESHSETSSARRGSLAVDYTKKESIATFGKNVYSDVDTNEFQRLSSSTALDVSRLSHGFRCSSAKAFQKFVRMLNRCSKAIVIPGFQPMEVEVETRIRLSIRSPIIPVSLMQVQILKIQVWIFIKESF